MRKAILKEIPMPANMFELGHAEDIEKMVMKHREMEKKKEK